MPGCYSRIKRAKEAKAPGVVAPAANKATTSIANAAPAPTPAASGLQPGEVIVLDGVRMTVGADGSVSAALRPMPAAGTTGPAVQRVPSTGNTQPPHAQSPRSLPTRRMASGKVPSTAYARTGFTVYEEDGRLWVFKAGSKHLAEFLRVGEPAKSTTPIGAGPGRMSIRAPDQETIDAYLAAGR